MEGCLFPAKVRLLSGWVGDVDLKKKELTQRSQRAQSSQRRVLIEENRDTSLVSRKETLFRKKRSVVQIEKTRVRAELRSMLRNDKERALRGAIRSGGLPWGRRRRRGVLGR